MIKKSIILFAVFIITCTNSIKSMNYGVMEALGQETKDAFVQWHKDNVEKLSPTQKAKVIKMINDKGARIICMFEKLSKSEKNIMEELKITDELKDMLKSLTSIFEIDKDPVLYFKESPENKAVISLMMLIFKTLKNEFSLLDKSFKKLEDLELRGKKASEKLKTLKESLSLTPELSEEEGKRILLNAVDDHRVYLMNYPLNYHIKISLKHTISNLNNILVPSLSLCTNAYKLCKNNGEILSLL